MRKVMLALVAVGIASMTAWYSTAAQKDDKEKDKPKYTIKQVMKKAHAAKDALLKKVQSGDASKEEMKELLAMYKSLEVNKPPRGEEADWKKRTKALVDAANAAVEKKKDASDLLKKAADCKGCHDLHKAAK
jgi:hypothetical protein